MYYIMPRSCHILLTTMTRMFQQICYSTSEDKMSCVLGHAFYQVLLVLYSRSVENVIEY